MFQLYFLSNHRPQLVCLERNQNVQDPRRTDRITLLKFAEGYRFNLFYSVLPILIAPPIFRQYSIHLFSWTYHGQEQSFYETVKHKQDKFVRQSNKWLLFNDIYIQPMLRGHLLCPNMTMCPYKQLEESQQVQVNQDGKYLF